MKPKNKSALMVYLSVFREDAKIGYGYMYFHDGNYSNPELYDFDGNELDSMWYRIQMEETKLVVLNGTKQ